MNAFSLMTLYYTVLHIIATYDIIAWGGEYDNLLSYLQNRLMNNIRPEEKRINLFLSIKEYFLLETYSKL